VPKRNSWVNRMFERVKVDNTLELGAIAIELTLEDGRLLKGRLAIPMSKTVFEVLNGPGAFVDFEPFDGDRQYLAKTTLRAVKLVNPPKAANLAGKLKDMDGFDPHRILGVGTEAGWDDVRQAYHALAKAYHPDRYSSAELPAEVRDYLSVMARRINAAYAALESPHQARKQAAAERTDPVYARAAR